MRNPIALVTSVTLQKTVSAEYVEDSSLLTLYLINPNSGIASVIDIPLTSFGCVCTHEAMVNFVRESLPKAVSNAGFTTDVTNALIVIPVGLAENIKSR